MWNFRIFWGSPMWTIRKRRKSFRTSSLPRQEKTVEIQMLVADKHQHTNLANITVDQAIKNNIHMDVVIEEDPDEEKGE